MPVCFFPSSVRTVQLLKSTVGYCAASATPGPPSVNAARATAILVFIGLPPGGTSYNESVWERTPSATPLRRQDKDPIRCPRGSKAARPGRRHRPDRLRDRVHHDARLDRADL